MSLSLGCFLLENLSLPCRHSRPLGFRVLLGSHYFLYTDITKSEIIYIVHDTVTIIIIRVYILIGLYSTYVLGMTIRCG